MTITTVVGDYGKMTITTEIVIMANDNNDRNGDYGQGQQQP